MPVALRHALRSIVGRPWLMALAAVAACGSGRTGTAPAPAPAAAPAGSTSAVAARSIFKIEEIPGFTKAVDRGTRTRTGAPGPKYWQQWAEYKLQAELVPISKRLDGRGSVRYFNRSPDTLKTLYVHAYDNLFHEGAKRTTEIGTALGGIDFSKIQAQGKTLGLGTDDGPGYTIDGTIMAIRLPQPVAPGGTVDLDFVWSLRVPPDGAPRGGQDGEVYYLAYWYPQLAVYDDVNGWQIDQYLGNAEFYMGYGDYDVSITVPAGWLVTATGELTNAPDVLTAPIRARLDSAKHTGATVQIVGENDRGAGVATTAGTDGKLTWRFQAKNVRDVTWGASAKYLWDATSAAVGDANADGRADTTAIYSFYRPEQRRSYWDRSALYGKHSIEFFSKFLWPYPYSHMTAVDGPLSCGGMEYPMMTCIGGQWDTLSLYEVVTHEIGHMWFPMMVGSDEKRYAWMDEGLTQFDQSQSMKDFFKGYDDEEKNREGYLNFAQSGAETEIMRHGDKYPSYPAYAVATYYKTASVLVALRGVLGEETFDKAYREYGRRWNGKHPTPWDFFDTFEDVSGKDLSWFWRTWFFETWRLDQAIDSTSVKGNDLEVIVGNRGRAPMPILLAATMPDGKVERLTVPADVWFTGIKRFIAVIPGAALAKKVQIDPDRLFPDVNRENQSVTR